MATTGAIEISDTAVREIKRLTGKRDRAPRALRVGIRGGGCTGFSYLFEWSDDEPRPTDLVIEKDGVTVVCDPKSLLYLKGTTLDFVTSIMGHGFKFVNPNVKGQCGCGESVQF
jgi:iron-sulfur cluster assembly protein